MYFLPNSQHSSGDFDVIMLTNVYIFYIFVYTYTCNDMRSVMLQINEYDDDDDDTEFGRPICCFQYAWRSIPNLPYGRFW